MAYFNSSLTGQQIETVLTSTRSTNGILTCNGSGTVSKLATDGTAAQVATALNTLMHASGVVVGKGNGTIGTLDTDVSAASLASMITAAYNKSGLLKSDGSGNISAIGIDESFDYTSSNPVSNQTLAEKFLVVDTKLDSCTGLYIARYGTTTYAEIKSAVNDGNVVVATKATSGLTGIAQLCYIDSTTARFAYIYPVKDSTTSYYTVTSSTWSEVKIPNVSAIIVDYQYATYSSIKTCIDNGSYPVIQYTNNSINYTLNMCYYSSSEAKFRAISGSTTMLVITLSSSGTKSINTYALGPTVDSALSTTSTNTIQNKVVTTALNAKQASLTASTGIIISEDSAISVNVATDAEITEYLGLGS